MKDVVLDPISYMGNLILLMIYFTIGDIISMVLILRQVMTYLKF